LRAPASSGISHLDSIHQGVQNARILVDSNSSKYSKYYNNLSHFGTGKRANGQRVNLFKSISGSLGPPFQSDMCAGDAILLADLHKTVVIPFHYSHSPCLFGFERKGFFR
jgi:hypothetical protein